MGTAFGYTDSFGHWVVKIMQAVFAGRPRLACRHCGIMNWECEVLSPSLEARGRWGKGTALLKLGWNHCSSLCVCAHVCARVCVIYTGVLCMYAYVWNQPQILVPDAIQLGFLRQGLLINQASLASQWATWVLLSLPPRHWHYKRVPPPSPAFPMSWRRRRLKLAWQTLY